MDGRNKSKKRRPSISEQQSAIGQAPSVKDKEVDPYQTMIEVSPSYGVILNN